MRRSALALPLALVACGMGTSVTSTTGNSATTNGITTTRTVTTSTNSGAAPRHLAESASLAPYVGHYPEDRVGGSGFWENPLVQTAVLSAVSDPTMQQAILHPTGPATPIARMPDGRIVAWSCQVHNCGSHNWSLVVADDASNPEVCYHDDSGSPVTRWFQYGQQTRASDEDCPTGETQDSDPPASTGGK